MTTCTSLVRLWVNVGIYFPDRNLLQFGTNSVDKQTIHYIDSYSTENKLVVMNVSLVQIVMLLYTTLYAYDWCS